MSPLLRAAHMTRHQQRAENWGNFFLGVAIGVALFLIASIEWTT